MVESKSLNEEEIKAFLEDKGKKEYRMETFRLIDEQLESNEEMDQEHAETLVKVVQTIETVLKRSAKFAKWLGEDCFSNL